MRDATTTNLDDFGSRERKMAAELLTLSCEQGFPDDFVDSGVVLMMNRNSGDVFFTNDECAVCMINPASEWLESWYFTPYHGHEGFADELKEMLDDTWNRQDVEFLRDVGIIDDDEFAEWCGEENNEEGDDDEMDS